MFTSRGYRHAKKENKHHSRQAQIIQQKPVFQIDNNPYVIEQYRKFILGDSKYIKPDMFKNEFDVTLSYYNLSWTQQTLIPQIMAQLESFAENLFNSYRQLGRFPISLELFSPNLDDSLAFTVSSTAMSSIYQQFAASFGSILIFPGGTISFTQNFLGYYYVTRTGTAYNYNNLTLGYGSKSDQPTRHYGNPDTMKAIIYYYNYVK